MRNTLESFNKSAEKLSKNPLGVIGLFIVLVYGIAALVSMTQSWEEQRTYLVWFLMLFPFTVLFVFYNLVTKHYNKLYSPSDYKDEGNFMKAIDKVTNMPAKEANLEVEQNQEDYKTLELIIELQKQVEELTIQVGVVSTKENDGIKKIQNKIAEDKKLLEETKKNLDWKGTKIQVNNLLNNYIEIKEIFHEKNIPISSEFGTTSNHPIVPKVNLLTFGKNVPIRHIQEIISMYNNLKMEFINVADSSNNKSGIYIGSYGYEYFNIARLSDLPFETMLKPDLTIQELINIIKSNANNNFVRRAHT